MRTYNELFKQCDELGIPIDPSNGYTKEGLENLIRNHQKDQSKASSVKGWEVISTYTMEQALSDGILVKCGWAISGKVKAPVVFTSNLFYSGGYTDADKRLKLIKLGLESLQKPDKEDDGYRKLRVLEQNKIWVIEDGTGITFMRPEDY
ncbi:MAG: hypothetical protein A2231_11385 [Candidatus Firestonebacteria bacterium RIFOXYA2_FULL_40_8]|nr:MAG: hypothetical protein A2231_11385 [Candidatus Firestonebacteria bacterium RIFOXYA2_FULL_40_8]